jgi:hypothetical protein
MSYAQRNVKNLPYVLTASAAATKGGTSNRARTRLYDGLAGHRRKVWPRAIADHFENNDPTAWSARPAPFSSQVVAPPGPFRLYGVQPHRPACIARFKRLDAVQERQTTAGLAQSNSCSSRRRPQRESLFGVRSEAKYTEDRRALVAGAYAPRGVPRGTGGLVNLRFARHFPSTSRCSGA